jgi:transposase InsO family protein
LRAIPRRERRFGRAAPLAGSATAKKRRFLAEKEPPRSGSPFDACGKSDEQRERRRGRDLGMFVNKKRVYRLMRATQLQSVIRRKRKKYAKFTPEITAENILNRNFAADKLNEKWLTDVTEFKYGAGEKAYLSAILDLKDKSVVSYVVGRRNDNKLAFDTFSAAVARYPDAKPLFHSDRGFQYTSRVFRAKLDAQGMTQSMSRPGRCIDNGPMEAFWGTLKVEMYYLRRFDDYDSLKAAIAEYIDFYNYARYQEKLGGFAPMEYRGLLLSA